MAIVRTRLKLPATSKARGKQVKIDATRIQRWCDNFAALKASGVEIGVPWGHFDEASPNAREFLSSRFNAGYLKDMQVGPDGKLDVVLDCPGLEQGENGQLLGEAKLPDGTTVKTAIKEVSPGIWDSWTDGQGKTHSDIIGHMALCMMPVVAGQDGFTGLSTMVGVKSAAKVTYLATEMESLQDDVEEVTDEGDGGDGDEVDSLLNASDPPANVEQERMTRLLALLAQGGMTLPPDTNSGNIIERLETAVGVLLAAQQKSKSSVPDAAADPLTEEPNPAGGGVMLSTLAKRSKSDPLLRSLLKRELQRVGETRTSRIDALVLRLLPPVEADALRGRKVFLSTLVNDDGVISDDETDRMIAFAERILPSKEMAATFLGTVTTPAVEHAPPIDDGEPTERVGTIKMTKAQKKQHDQRMARVEGRPVTA